MAGSRSARPTSPTGSSSQTRSRRAGSRATRASPATRRAWRICPRWWRPSRRYSSSAALRTGWGGFEAAGVPAGPVLDVAEMHADPQTQARKMVVEVPHSRLGKTKTLGTAVKFSATPSDVRRGAPVLGEHTREVLREYGYADTQIDALAAAGVVIA